MDAVLNGEKYFSEDLKFLSEVKLSEDKESLLRKYTEESLRRLAWKVKNFDYVECPFSEVVGEMATLANFYNRLLDGNYEEVVYPEEGLLRLLVNTTRSECRGKKMSMRVNYYGDLFAGITILADDEEVLAIRSFEEDRLDNEALISLSYTRGEPKNRFVLFSNHYMIGKNGIFASTNECNFIHGIKDTMTEAFSQTFPFTYNYNPLNYLCGDKTNSVIFISIDRREGTRDVYHNDGVDHQKFCGIYDLTLVGGVPRDDDNLMDFIYTSRLKDATPPKEYVDVYLKK